MSLLHDHPAAHGRTAPSPGKRLRRTVTAATGVALPVTVAEFAEFLGDPCPPSDGSIQKSQWETYLRTAAAKIIEYTDREMLERDITVTFDAAGQGSVGGYPVSLVRLFEKTPVWLDLPRVPATTDLTVELTDRDGSTTTVDAADFTADTRSEPHRLSLDDMPARNELALFNGIKVSYTAGYASGAVPGAMITATLQLAALYYERRGMVGREPMAESGARDIVRSLRVATGL